MGTTDLEDATAVFSMLYDVEREKMDRQLSADLLATTSKLSNNGMLYSSSAVMIMTRAASNTIPLRSQTALNILLRSFSAHGIGLNSTTLPQVFLILSDLLTEEEARLLAMISDTPSFKNESIRAMSTGLTSDLEVVTDLERRRIDGELRLMASANRSEQATSTTTSTSGMVFNGPVGVVQTGPGSYGVANQVIDATSSAEVLKALDVVELALKELGDSAVPEGEVRELLSEAKTELQKPKPNQSKVKALVSGIGSAISFAPQIRPAYDTLKWAAAFIGVTLP